MKAYLWLLRQAEKHERRARVWAYMADNWRYDPWLIARASRHQTLANYYRTAAHTWRTLWAGQQLHK